MVGLCLSCNTLTWDKTLCDVCRKGLFEKREILRRPFKGFSSFSLFSWKQNDSALIHLSKRLKQVESQRCWKPFAEWLIHERMQLDSYRNVNSSTVLPWSHAVFIPVPSSNKRNHALGFAKTLARMSGLAFETPLLPFDQHGKQRFKSRSERFARKLATNSGREYTNVIIVDDIITTGATAQAAFEALKRPKHCEVWCLMDRRPCGS